MSGAESIVIIFVLISLAITVLSFMAAWKIVTKAGYPGWWVFITLLPVVGTVMVFVFAFSDWPVLRRLRGLEASQGQVTASSAGEPSSPAYLAGEPSSPANPAGEASPGAARLAAAPAAAAADSPSSGRGYAGNASRGQQPPHYRSHAHRAAPGGTTAWLLAAGAACFILLFFSWNSLSACSPVTFGGSAPCVALGGEIGWGGVGFLAGLAVTGLLAWEGLAWGGVLEALDHTVAAVVPPGLAGAAALFAVIRVLTHAGGASAAAWLGLLAFLALALLAVLRWRALPARTASATVGAEASPATPATPASPPRAAPPGSPLAGPASRATPRSPAATAPVQQAASATQNQPASAGAETAVAARPPVRSLLRP